MESKICYLHVKDWRQQQSSGLMLRQQCLVPLESMGGDGITTQYSSVSVRPELILLGNYVRERASC